MSEKTAAEMLKEERFAETKHASYTCTDDEIAVADDFCVGYADFLNKCKTEREAVAYTKALAEKEGFTAFDPAASYEAGDKV